MSVKGEVLFQIDGLCKAFGANLVLDHISTQIRSGEVVVIVGPSGSGKSTFLRSLNLLEMPTQGTISFEGMNITDKKTDINQYRQKIGMVFQHFNLFPHKTILENLTLAPIKLLKKSKREAEEEARALLARVGLSEKENAYPAQLSGGQKQRIAIVRALAMHPEVMLFDEPTSALDPGGRAEVIEIIERLKKTGCTIVLSTHILSDVERVADHIGIINNGVIAEEGRLDDILHKYGGDFVALKVSSLTESLFRTLLAADFAKVEFNELNGEFKFSADNTEECSRKLIKLLAENNAAAASISTCSIGLEEVFRKVVG